MKSRTGGKSAVLCEGRDDLWFISYYLLKTAGWDNQDAKKLWKTYQVSVPDKWKVSSEQSASDTWNVNYLKKNEDTAVIWSVGGKNAYQKPIKTLLTFNEKYPDDPVDSIVIVRDRDNQTDEAIFQEWTAQSYFPEQLALENRLSTDYVLTSRDGRDVSVHVTPVIIPFREEGAVETLLMNSTRESGEGGAEIVRAAKDFVESLSACDSVREAGYLRGQRMILKAKYSSVIAITNPDHSTGQFQDMVMACEWEKHSTVREHFEVIRKSITSNE